MDPEPENELRQSIEYAMESMNFQEQSVLKLPGSAHEDLSVISDALRTVLAVAAASLGECRRSTPYSTLRPVIDADGDFRWCCNHDPEHCSG